MNSRLSIRKRTMTEKYKQSVRVRIAALAAAALVVFADQLTKALAVRALVNEGASMTAIPGVLDFTYVLNSGATAGILANHRWIFMSVSTVVIIAAIVYIALGKMRSSFSAVSLALIIGGGIGNMIDRVASGKVVDFIDVTLVDFFPFNTVFNVADTFVTVGCALLVISIIIEEIKDRKAKRETAQPEEKTEDKND